MSRGTLTERPLLAANLRKARIALGLSQKEVAARLNTTDVTVSNHERGFTKPSDLQLEDYGWLYGLTVQQIRYGESLGFLPKELREPLEELEKFDYPSVPPSQVRERQSKSAYPAAVREYLAELRLRLVRAGATDEQVEEALDLFKSPEVFTFFSGGMTQPLSESDILANVQTLAEEAVIPTLKRRGLKLEARERPAIPAGGAFAARIQTVHTEPRSSRRPPRK